MLQKRLYYGFNGYQVPFIPRAARSARRSGPVGKKVDDNQMCAFDLLATVAGKILLEGGNSENTISGKDQAVTDEDIVMKEQYDEGNPLKLEHCDQETGEVPSLSLELGLQIPGLLPDISPAPSSVISSLDCMEKDDSLDKMDLLDDKGGLCSDDSGKQEGRSPVHLESCLPNMNEALLTSDRSVKLSSGKDQYPCGSLSTSRGNNVKVVTRDDDENLSECTQPSTTKTTRSLARIGDRRIRKLLASKYWRVAPKLKDGDLSDTEMRCVYRSRKIGYKRQRSQRIYPFKKRKFFHYSSLSNSNGDRGCKGVYNSSEKGIGPVGHGVNGSSSCVAGQSTTFQSRESHVKLRINSFRVPELFIEVPEIATIGSLKRTVMEAVTALLGGGLRVGVLLQGKKIRDDNRTLLQSGICHDDKGDSLGFSLEPNPSPTTLPVCSEDTSLLLSTDLTESVSRSPGRSTIHLETSHVPSDQLVTNFGNLIESDHDSAPSPAEISADKATVDSQALVALPEGAPQALAVVPSNQSCKRSEIGQRRIRRPFSVSEVEALVQAVEKLGTGRWRDVKLRAFDNVKHRTYVDLKDKWKTLVHTARISRQQRRGEPVPQELLDRVLAAHAYWSQQQAKQHLKQQSESCLLL